MAYERFVDFVFNITCWCLWALNKKTFINTNIEIAYLLDLLLREMKLGGYRLVELIQPT